jgi:hypothetical protein
LWIHFFQRGDVKISLVGEGIDKAKVFRNVYRPQSVQAELSRRQARAKAANEQGELQRQRETMAEYLSVYHETIQGMGNTPQNAQVQPGMPVSPYSAQDRERPPGVPRVRDDDNNADWNIPGMPPPQW